MVTPPAPISAHLVKIIPLELISVQQMRRESQPGRTSFLRIFLPAFLLLSAASMLWSLASPVFSSPDESAHATKAIAQVRGQVIGDKVAGSPFLVVRLPDSYRFSPTMMCFVYNPDRAANCGVELGTPTGTNFFGTQVSTYNPIYYFVVGWPSLLFGGSAGLYAMRLASGLFSSIFLAWAVQAGMAGARNRWMPAAVMFLASPIVVYMAGSVNPQGLEIAAAAALWIGLVRLLQSQADDRAPNSLSRTYLWVIVTVSAIALASARALGPLWVVIVVVGCFAYAGRADIRGLFTRRSSYIPIALIALGGLFSLAWTLKGGSLSGQASKNDAPLVGASFFRGAWTMLRDTPLFIQQAVGVFGWLDTTLPVMVYMLFFVAFSLLTAIAALAAGRRAAVTMTILVAAAVLVPVFVQACSVHQTGIIWQGRYGIFIYIAIPIFAGLVLSSAAGSRVAFLSTRTTIVIGTLLWLFVVTAFLLVLRRYVVGNGTPITKMINHAEWQPPLGWMTLFALFIGVSGFFFFWLCRLAASSARAEVLSSVIRP